MKFDHAKRDRIEALQAKGCWTDDELQELIDAYDAAHTAIGTLGPRYDVIGDDIRQRLHTYEVCMRSRRSQ